jgi:hypothetical protein
MNRDGPDNKFAEVLFPHKIYIKHAYARTKHYTRTLHCTSP